MRISAEECKTIVDHIHARDPQAEIYLFGSRVDDSLKGGDIDLLVVSTRIDLKAKIEILVDLKMALGDQRIDLSIVSAENLHTDAFSASVISKAIRLS